MHYVFVQIQEESKAGHSGSISSADIYRVVPWRHGLWHKDAENTR